MNGRTYAVHLAGPVSANRQACPRCKAVIADEGDKRTFPEGERVGMPLGGGYPFALDGRDLDEDEEECRG